ncbi:MAG: hypothetical protein EBR82_34720 [Caulobacteraceae bacterium]|nr:hypothetical protein [Caulobacteraceae bacterium]
MKKGVRYTEVQAHTREENAWRPRSSWARTRRFPTSPATNIKRGEPINDKISQTLTIKPGYALDAGDQITV